MKKKAKRRVSYVRINSFTIHFLGQDKREDEYHKTTYRIKPLCQYPRNVMATIFDDVRRSIGNDTRPVIVEVSTTKGKFFYTKRQIRR